MPSKRYGKLLSRCDRLDDAIQAYRLTNKGIDEVTDAIFAVMDQVSIPQLIHVAETIRDIAKRRRRKSKVEPVLEELEECITETDEKQKTATR